MTLGANIKTALKEGGEVKRVVEIILNLDDRVLGLAPADKASLEQIVQDTESGISSEAIEAAKRVLEDEAARDWFI